MDIISQILPNTLQKINNIYEYIISLDINNILRENILIISISFYLLWYVKAYLSRTEIVAKENSYIHR